MTTFDALGLPIFETTDKVAATGDGLREDLNLIGASARNAITAEGARAETSAKSYADTKDTSNRAAWAAADTAKLAEAKAYADTQDAAKLIEAKAYTDAAKWDRGSTTADLDTLQSSGRYNVTSTTTPNLPISAAGTLEVLWSSTTGTQRFTVREANPRVYLRNYSSGSWTAWGKGETGVRLDAIESLNTTQDGRLTAVEGVNTTQDTRITNAETAATALTGRVTATETKNTAQDGRLTSLEAVAPKVSNIALDADGVPYYSPGSTAVHIIQDTDGTPYFIRFMSASLDTDGATYFA